MSTTDVRSDELPSTLLWVVDREVNFGRLWGNESHRNTPGVAPTWSWGSVTGRVAFLFWHLSYGRGKWAEREPDFTDVTVKCTPVGRNRVWLTGGSEWHFPFRMETKKADGTVGKTNGFFYPDTEDVLGELQAGRRDGVEMVVVGVYESRMFLVLRKVGVGKLVFERMIHYNEFDRVVLKDWGRKERFTIV
ncbi:hypothetical protein VC83_00248 [Pseudogymnoascus destructans]|uniref:Uncharacterized protein n=1 Tax=Pseudogymnoascus destructans TaxID=655981 RepID=A0A177ALP1_9PEZI|nr:uncharacterized protein VC83_00248 [Pseudogymnoascus destructans]OAF62979.1 hypothetical protein VC83_00248 [Pseudogymnoascus destructans]